MPHFTVYPTQSFQIQGEEDDWHRLSPAALDLNGCLVNGDYSVLSRTDGDRRSMHDSEDCS